LPLHCSDGNGWIKSRTGEDTLDINLVTPPWENPDPTLSHLEPADAVVDLPPRHIMDEYSARYSRDAFRSTFPVVDPILLRHTVEETYNQLPRRSDCEEHARATRIAAKACLQGFLSFMSVLLRTRRLTPVDADSLAASSRVLLSQVADHGSILVAQAAMTQALYLEFNGRSHAASVYRGMAVRTLFQLGAHLLPTAGFDVDIPATATIALHRRHLRSLFWMAYTFDKDFALRTGQPPLIHDDNCDLTLPEGYLDRPPDKSCAMPRPRPTAVSSARLDMLLPGDLRLDLLKSETYTMLYSAKAMRKSEVQLLQDIRELDTKLETWRMGIDPLLRPRLTYPAGYMFDLGQRMHHIMITLQYHHLISRIHGATGRCRHLSTDEGLSAAFASSMALAVEASRSTLHFIQGLDQDLLGGPFWVVLFYPLSAIHVLFCDILTNPSEPAAMGDLRLLEATPVLVKNMRNMYLKDSEVEQLARVERFVAELVRLGHKAVARAR
ncbi:uncharacterized protein B0I36DRAFT_208134, partial [Microdochium trichocladiopsis]